MARPRELDDKKLLKILNLFKDKQDRKRALASLNKNGKVSNPTLGRWLDILENDEELILRIPNTRPQLFDLTYKGGQKLTELRNCITLEHPDILQSQKTIYSLEGYSVKYPIIKKGEIFTPNIVQMNNWIQKIDNWKDCNIRLNETNDGKPISLTIEPLSMIGKDKNTLLLRARAICDSGAHLLQRQFGFILGTGEPGKNITIEISDEVTRALHGEYGYVSGHLDASKLEGEINFKGSDPTEVSEKVQAWEDMPEIQNKMLKELQYLHAQNDILMSTVANLIHDQADSKKALNDLLSKFNQPEPEQTTPPTPTDPIPPGLKADERPNEGVECA